MDIHVNYEPVEWAKAFHTSHIKHTCLVGGLGSGKSTAMIEEIKALALENPGFTYLIGRKTMPSLRDTTMKTFFSRMEDGLIKKFDKTHSIATLVNNSEIIFRPLDDLEKMKSLEVAGFGLDEANEIDQEMYNTLKSRVRQKVKGKEPTMYRTILSLNPTEEDHWIPQHFMHIKPTDSVMFTSTTLDNLKNLPDGYVEELKRTYTKDMQARMIYGLFGKVHKGRPVFPQFSRGNYVSPIAFDPTAAVIRAWDFGYNHPAVVWAQMRNKRIVVLAEMMGKEVYLQDFIRDTVIPFQATIFGDKLNHKCIDFCDPRGSDSSDKGKSSVQILNDHGIWPAYRRTWIEEGIKVIKDLMDTVDTEGVPNLLVHPRCKILIEGFRGGYARLDGSEEPNKDDYYDHLQDCFRYLAIHAVQRAKISGLMKDSQPSKVYTNRFTGRRVEL